MVNKKDPLDVAFCPCCLKRVNKRLKDCPHCGSQFVSYNSNSDTSIKTIRQIINGDFDHGKNGGDEWHGAKVYAFVEMIIKLIKENPDVL